MSVEATRRGGEPGARSYYHNKPKWLVQTTDIAEPTVSKRAPFYYFFDHFDTVQGILLWLGLNAALAEVAIRAPIVASIQGWMTIALCITVALNSQRLMVVLSMMSYAAVSDTFWRMTKAGVPWETSKYVVTAMCVIILVRWIGKPQSGFCTAIMLLLIPGAVEGWQALGFNTFKTTTSFVLLGMYVLAIASMVFRRLRCNWSEVRLMLWAMIGPATAVGSIAANSVAKLTTASFTNIQSNDAASGNFGANQVGAVLGLGALMALFIALQEDKWTERLICLGLVTWFTAQSAITLSRGGLAAVAVALLVAAPHIILHDRLGLRFLMVITFVCLVAGIVLLPRLDTFTNGAVNKRFHDTDSTERGQLAAIDMHLFAEHPFFGVGVGVSDQYHYTPETPFALASHTEFTRLLAEHGILGLAVIFCMLGLFVEAYKRQKNWFGRAWTIGLVGWVIVDLSVASTRNAMNTYVFALAMLAIDDKLADDVPDIDTEVFGESHPIIDVELAEPVDETPVVDPALEAERAAALKRLRRAYRTANNPNTGSAITFDMD